MNTALPMIIKSALTMLFLAALSLPAHAMVYVGSWDLRGNGQSDTVYRISTGIRIVSPSGARRDYPIRNNAWSLYGAADTDGYPGAELIVRAGNEAIIINHSSQSQRSYNMGNVSWAIIQDADVDNVPGHEVLISTPSSVKVVNDVKGSVRDIPISNRSIVWSLFGLANLSGNGLDLVINTPDGVIIVDPRTYSSKSFSLPGSSAIVGTASLAKGDIQHVYARTPSHVYVISGGTRGSVTPYQLGTAENWAIYHQTADTNGKEGDEIIVKMAYSVVTISHASKGMRSHRIGTSFVIEAVEDRDNKAGKEIIVKTFAGATHVINDTTSTGVMPR